MPRRALLVCFLLAVSAGCGSSGRTKSAILSGKVTLDGKPVGELTLVVTGPDGKQSGGNTNAAGEYRIPDPPLGKLEFQFIAPGTGPGPKIPPKYAKPKNGVSVDYKGGNQVEDLKLTS